MDELQDALQEELSLMNRPQWRDLLPIQFVYLCIHMICVAPSGVHMIKQLVSGKPEETDDIEETEYFGKTNNFCKDCLWSISILQRSHCIFYYGNPL